jgi:hypothetical protein
MHREAQLRLMAAMYKQIYYHTLEYKMTYQDVIKAIQELMYEVYVDFVEDKKGSGEKDAKS